MILHYVNYNYITNNVRLFSINITKNKYLELIVFLIRNKCKIDVCVNLNNEFCIHGKNENIFFSLIPYNQYRTILWEKIIKIRNKQKILKTKNNKKVILERNIVKNKNKVLSTARNSIYSICVFSFNTSMKHYKTNETIKFSKIRNQTNNNHNSKRKEKIKNPRNKSFLERFLFNGV